LQKIQFRRYSSKKRDDSSPITPRLLMSQSQKKQHH
jgi:hypothetical protein